jgi:hypothetical protein
MRFLNLPDAVSGAELIGLLEEAQLVELLTLQRDIWIDGLGEDFLHGVGQPQRQQGGMWLTRQRCMQLDKQGI